MLFIFYPSGALPCFIDLLTWETIGIWSIKKMIPWPFYDAMTFWDNKNGIAMGDPTEGCLSIILTSDGGHSWSKVSCDNLPSAAEGEAAFAASDGNIAVAGSNAWVVSGGKKSRVFHSPDYGATWNVYDTPITKGRSDGPAYLGVIFLIVQLES